MDISTRTTIAHDIRREGFYMVAVSSAAECECCKHEAQEAGKERPHVFTKDDDGVVFTIGQHLKGRPELLALVGPTPTEGMLTKKQLTDRIHDAASFLAMVAKEWKNLELRYGLIYSQNKDFGWVMVPEEQDTDGQESAKEIYLNGVSDYYGSDAYSVMVFRPFTEKDNSLRG